VTIVPICGCGAASSDIIGNIMELRAVLDTNVLIAALSSRRGASFALLRWAIDRRFSLLASPALWLEYEAVLKRPEIVRLHQLTLQDVDDVLHALCEVVEPVQSHFLWRPQLRDPNDEMVLEAAITGAATHLVSFNLRDFDPSVQRHALSRPSRLGPVACCPADLLKLMEKPS
jgi:putative PIN family toxin of toxin-antitoxin system